MPFNEQLVTEDFVELLDDHVLTSSLHTYRFGAVPFPFSLARESYRDILTRLEGFVLTPQQRAALATTLTAPSALNPVVLRDDLPVYFPEIDVGSIKDSVATFADLPIVGNHLNDIRAVLDENVLYRWDGAAWLAFLRTGTLLHTALQNLDGLTTYRHLTAAQLGALTANVHHHDNQTVLDAITSLGSGIVMTDLERSLLPSANQKDALAGSHGLPSSYNRYVTSTDPRLNTIKNPYITVGPSGSGALFMGSDIAPFRQALAAVLTDHTDVAAVETFPGSFDMQANFDYAPLQWSAVKGLLLEATTPHTTSLSFRDCAQPETTLVVTKADESGSLNGLYFLLNRPFTDGYYVWLNVAGTGSDPVVPDRTGVEVAVPFSGTAYQIALALQTAMAGLPYNVTRFGDQVTITNQEAGEVEDASDPTGAVASITIVVPGTSGAVQILDAADAEPVTIRGIDFTLQGAGTDGILVRRPNVLIENCSFDAPSIDGVAGVVVEAEFCTIRNCRFRGNVLGVAVRAAFCTIQDCDFDVNEALSVEAPNATVRGCSFRAGTVTIEAVEGVAFSQNWFATPSLLFDSGLNTRWLMNAPLPAGQPFGARRRTVGFPGSYADYRGADDAPFTAALSDPLVTEVVVLEGHYQFGSTVTIPSGKAIWGVRQGKGVDARACTITPNGVTGVADITCPSMVLTERDPVVFSGATAPIGIVFGKLYFVRNASGFSFRISDTPYGNAVTVLDSGLNVTVSRATVLVRSDGVAAFEMQSHTSLQDIDVSTSLNSAIRIHDCHDAVVNRCMLDSRAAGADYAVNVANARYVEILNCQVTGVKGVRVQDSQDILVDACRIATSDTDVLTQNVTNSDFVDTDYHGSCRFGGERLVIQGNRFLAGAPLKTETTDSVWEQNYPHAAANNLEGVDVLALSLAGALAPLAGCGRASLQDGGVLAFTEVGTGRAATMPFPLGVKINTALPYSVEIKWTSSTSSGDVVWRVGVAFRDANGTLGNAETVVAISPRTELVPNLQESVVLDFTSYGGSAPTDVALVVERLGADPLDTLAGDVYLSTLTLTLPRD